MIPNSNLASILGYKYPDLINGEDYECVQSSEKIGPVIENWTAEEPEPTVKEVMAFEQEWLDHQKTTAYVKLWEKACIEKWPVFAQLEAHAEDKAGRPEKLEQMLLDFDEIRDEIPKPV